MVRKVSEDRSCDACGKDGAAQRRIVLPPFDAAGQRRITVDLCPACRKSLTLDDIERMMPVKPRATRSVRVASLAEVKAARVKRRPRKKIG